MTAVGPDQLQKLLAELLLRIRRVLRSRNTRSISSPLATEICLGGDQLLSQPELIGVLKPGQDDRPITGDAKPPQALLAPNG